MNALITGITGFAGKHLATRLLEEGDVVLGVARRSEWPEDADSSLRFVPLAVWNMGECERPDAAAVARIRDFAPDVIYHLAAVSVPERVGKDAPSNEAWRTNVEGTRRLLELAAELPSRPRVLFTSSSYVYSRPECGFRLDEDARIGPRHPYGQTKLAAEELCRRFAREEGLEVIIARSFQHTGPGQSAEMMLPEWASQYAAGGDRPIRVRNLSTSIDLTDVRDVVRAYRLLIIECGGPSLRGPRSGDTCPTLNIGAGSRQSTGDIFRLLQHLADPERRRPVVETSPGVKHDPIADNTRLVAVSGWKPRLPIAQTVTDILDDWKKRELAT